MIKIFTKIRLMVMRKSGVKHLESCEHVKSGAEVYAVYRVERWIQRDGKYVKTGYADQQLCLTCCCIMP